MDDVDGQVRGWKSRTFRSLAGLMSTGLTILTRYAPSWVELGLVPVYLYLALVIFLIQIGLLMATVVINDQE